MLKHTQIQLHSTATNIKLHAQYMHGHQYKPSAIAKITCTVYAWASV